MDRSLRLGFVTFVEDYVQLGSDDYRLTIFNPIRLSKGSECINQMQDRFKDSLCKLINQSVRDVEYQKDRSVSLGFGYSQIEEVSEQLLARHKCKRSQPGEQEQRDQRHT